MYVITHAAVGALIAEQMPTHPWLAFLIGFVLHFVIDIIPHGDSEVYEGFVSKTRMKRAVAYVVIDSIAALGFVMMLFNADIIANRFATSMGILGSVLPDLLVAVEEVTHAKSLKGFHRVHFFFHNLICNKRGRDISFASGFAVQFVFLAAVLSRLG